MRKSHYTLWQNRVFNIWNRSPRAVKWLLSRVAYAVCEQLDSITTEPTINTRLAMGQVLAIANVLDLDELARHPPPPVLQKELPFQLARDWREIQSMAGLDASHLELLLERHPELARYKRKPEVPQPALAGG